MKTSLPFWRRDRCIAVCYCRFAAIASRPQHGLQLLCTPFPALLAALALVSMSLCANAETPITNQTDLTEMPVEKLMEIEVYSPSKRAEKLSEAPAAISVLTSDDIKRSGARSIPEALRLVPGLDVAQLDAEQWAISARGFNDVFANKLLVLQDGRSLYTPLFSGVFWNVQDAMLEDIDRIEVIRGPGASLWGANAVNGVINIITKSAKDTQGLLVSGGGGTIERGFAAVRYGGTLGDDLYFRVYGKYSDRADSVFPNGTDAQDSWQRGQGGFRLDWDKMENTGNLLTLQGDIYGSLGNQTFNTFAPSNPPLYSQVVHQDDYRTGGGNLLGRWTHQFSDSSDLKLQTYYDRTEQSTVIFKERRDTFDLDLQHHFTLGSWNNFTWGGEYRLSADKLDNTPTVSFTPDHQTTQLFSAFAQDELTILPDRVHLTAGAKLEHNDYTGWEVQPSGRLTWTPSQRQTLWGAISRAVRTPSRAEEDVKLSSALPPGALFPGSPPAVSTIYGNQDFESEKLTAYELGYRVEPLRTVALDLALFYNVYDDLRSQQLGFSPTQPPTAPPPPPAFFIPLNLQNGLQGDTYGGELAATWQLTDWWRLQPSYSLLKMHLRTKPGSTDTTSVAAAEGSSPQQQFSLRSTMDLPFHLSFDWTLRFVDELPALAIHSYFALDLRLAWRPTDSLELAVVGQNLLNARHAEFVPTFIGTQVTEVPAGVYGQITWRFDKKH